MSMWREVWILKEGPSHAGLEIIQPPWWWLGVKEKCVFPDQLPRGCWLLLGEICQKEVYSALPTISCLLWLLPGYHWRSWLQRQFAFKIKLVAYCWYRHISKDRTLFWRLMFCFSRFTIAEPVLGKCFHTSVGRLW